MRIASMGKTGQMAGVIHSTDCRLPVAFKFYGELINPMDGLRGVYRGVMYNDLLVQTEKGLVFTSSFEVRRSKKQLAKNYLEADGHENAARQC